MTKFGLNSPSRQMRNCQAFEVKLKMWFLAPLPVSVVCFSLVVCYPALFFFYFIFRFFPSQVHYSDFP